MLAVLAVLPALGVVWLVAVVVRFAASDYPLGGRPEKVPCAEALGFGGAKLPDGAYDTACTGQAWLDTDYVARFRMPRDGVRDWLKTTYPDAPEPKTRFCGPDSVDLCLNLGFEQGAGDYAGRVPGRSDPGFGAYAVDIDVTYEGPDRALVRFSAFTT
ncbi:hypothetical protein ABZ079_07740 [Streptomyces sp. NPDC006314]|uniref:hypothetical protein n=1 Tax=Streptomyces sp. NPDC006314 TaxID=3154475 RepID=UPI0033AA34BC